MLIDELIEVVEKRKTCHSRFFGGVCIDAPCRECIYHIDRQKMEEMYADILFHLKHEKWAQDKMEEMRVEEVD